MALNAECFLLSVIYAECCYAKCRGASTLPRQPVCPVDSDNVLGSLALGRNSNRKKQVPKKRKRLSRIYTGDFKVRNVEIADRCDSKS
jgi:hypothetical protein